jgi:hypothetical protein
MEHAKAMLAYVIWDERNGNASQVGLVTSEDGRSRRREEANCVRKRPCEGASPSCERRVSGGKASLGE